MSKLKKLVSNPSLFFRDYFDKRLGISNTRKPLVVKKTANVQSKSSSKSPANAQAKVEPETLNISYLNVYKKIPHIIHTGEGMTHGPSHLNLWIPQFLRSGEEFAVLVRHETLFSWVKKAYPFVNVVYAKKPIDVENLLSHLAYVKAFYYLSNTGNLIHSLRFNGFQHIFLGHGDSDKAASAHKFFRVYDQVWVAGQAHVDRFRNAPFETKHIDFIKVGRPALKQVLNNTEGDWRERFSKWRILYLPTWEGVYEENNYSSARLSTLLLTELQKRYDVYISAKFHPVTGSRNPVLANIDQKVSDALVELNVDFNIADKSENLVDLIINANIYICDISAVVSECIAGNGPIFVYIPKDKEITISNSNMSYEDYAYTFSSIEELCQLFEEVVINGNDYLAEQRKQARNYLLSVDETLSEEFTRRLSAIASEQPYAVTYREDIVQ